MALRRWVSFCATCGVTLSARQPLSGYEHVLVLSGDVPLLRPETIIKVRDFHLGRQATMTVVTAEQEFVGTLVDHTTRGLNATSYVRMMNHTAAVNIGLCFGLKGRVITTSSACTAGSQGIGYAFETIRFGLQDVMLAGGAEELSPTEVAVFDTLLATSTRNDAPACTPRPFDAERDGFVVDRGQRPAPVRLRDHADGGQVEAVDGVGHAEPEDRERVHQEDRRDDGAADDDRDLEGDQGRYRDVRVLEGVANDHRPLAKAVGRGGALGRVLTARSAADAGQNAERLSRIF